jgi:hypothetical protein
MHLQVQIIPNFPERFLRVAELQRAFLINETTQTNWTNIAIYVTQTVKESQIITQGH